MDRNNKKMSQFVQMLRALLLRLDPWILVFSIAGLSMRIWYGLTQRVAILGDQLGYVEMGQQFHSWWKTPDAFRTPGYPLFITLLPNSLNWVRIAQALAVTVAALFASVLAATIFDRHAGRATALLGALFPPLITVAGPILSDALASAFFAISICCLCFRRVGLSGLLLALATLVRPNLIVATPVVLIFALTWSYGLKAKVRASIYILASFAVVFAPWMIRNQSLLGKPHPLGTNRIPFLLGVTLPVDTSSGSMGAAVRDDHYFMTANPSKGVRPLAKVVGIDPLDQLKANLKVNPVEQFKASLFWVRELWLWPFDDRLTYSRKPVLPSWLLVASHGAFLGLALSGMWWTRQSAITLVIASAVTALTLPFLVLQSSPRLAIPAVFLLLIPAGWAASRISKTLMPSVVRV